MHVISEIESLDEDIEIIDGEVRFIGLDKFRFIMMFFVCLFSFGTFTAKWYYGYIPLLSKFSAICFFIISGYFVLTESVDRSDRIKRTIKRTAITFGILSGAYLIVNIVYYTFILKQNILSSITLQSVFNFLVLNKWPFVIGENIWYVQSILYAYVIIYFLEKRNLLKYDLPLAIIFLIINFTTGEFARFIGFDFSGLKFLPPNFLTFALPVLLLTNFLHRNIGYIVDIPLLIYGGLFAAGLIIMGIEWSALMKSNMIAGFDMLFGYLLFAFVLCKFMLDFRDIPSFNTSFSEQCDFFSRVIYYVSPLIAVIINEILMRLPYYEYTGLIAGIPVFIISFVISDIALTVKYRVFHKELIRYPVIDENDDEEDDDDFFEPADER